MDMMLKKRTEELLGRKETWAEIKFLNNEQIRNAIEKAANEVDFRYKDYQKENVYKLIIDDIIEDLRKLKEKNEEINK